jgi:hypothetical protein
MPTFDYRADDAQGRRCKAAGLTALDMPGSCYASAACGPVT